MSAEVSYQSSVTVNGINLSNRVRETTYNTATDQIEAAASGDLAHVRLPGLDVASLRVKFIMDYAAGSVYHTLNPLVNIIFPVLYKKDGTLPTTVSNPQYALTCMMEGFDPALGTMGALMEIDVTFSLASGSVVVTEA